MKAKEIRGTDKNMLNEKILELKKELVKVNAQVAIGTALKNPGQVRKIKKTIARILTIQNEKTSQISQIPGVNKSKKDINKKDPKKVKQPEVDKKA